MPQSYFFTYYTALQESIRITAFYSGIIMAITEHLFMRIFDEALTQVVTFLKTTKIKTLERFIFECKR